MNNINVLICDDNIAVHESLSVYLKAANMNVLSAYDGSHIMDILDKEKVDLIILDVLMPGKFGTDVCKEIRQKSDIPIIMLSAKTEEDDRILGLELGADDYVTKPFSPREIVMRITRILKRSQPKPRPSAIQLFNLTIYEDSYRALIQDQQMDLTPKEFSVLHTLVKTPDKVLSRDYILDAVWGYDYYGDTRAVDTIVKRLRTKLSKAGADFTIHSVYGVGYKLEAQK